LDPKHRARGAAIDSSELALRMCEITKDYPAVHALKRVDIQVSKGEIVGLVGANGAGKSTLVKILGGQLKNYSGTIAINNVPVKLSSPTVSRECGIAVLPQEPQFAWNLSIRDNLLLFGGVRPTLWAPLSGTWNHKRAETVLVQYISGLSPDTTVGSLTRRQLQLLQIARLALCDSALLVLDEPTTTLTQSESQQLFSFVREKASQGCGVIVISHNIDDVFSLCDRIIVLRDGSRAADLSRNETTRDAVLAAMFGPAPKKDIAEQFATTEDAALEVRKIRTQSIPNLSFTLRQGEALGLTGRNSDATDVIRTLYGLNGDSTTDIIMFGQHRGVRNPPDAQHFGFGYIPEDRMRDGLFPTLSILLNITFLVLGRYLRHGALSWGALRKAAGHIVTELRITLPSLEATIGTLSGGNQQRVLLGRWLCRGARIYLLEEPTAGMDVAAKEEVTVIMRRLRKEGASLLMSSNDPDELLRMCGRILVLSPHGCTEILADQSAARVDLISALADTGNTQ